MISTPSFEVLKGITRKNVIDMAKKNYSVFERPVLVEELMTAPEVFITSSAKGVIPIVSIDAQEIGDGTVGPVTKSLQQDFEALVQGIIDKDN